MTIKKFADGGNVIIRSVNDHNIIDHVPAAVYKLRFNPMSGEVILVKDRESFEVPSKFYGRHNANKEAILKEYKATASSVGVVLRGIKGAGKSVLAEDLGNHLLGTYVPVIMVDEAMPKVVLEMVISQVGPCMMYFDEFGKVYSESQRRDLLTFFSDSSHKKVLFVVTSNSKKELDKFMINRPGRFLFMIEYRSLDPLAIVEMIDDHHLTPGMALMMNAFVQHREVTFDMLRFLIPIAAECKDYLEFNDRIAILNTPDPVFPSLKIDKIIYKGAPFYGNIRMKIGEHGTYELTMLVETQPEPIFVGTFTMETRSQVMEESFFHRVHQFVVHDDVLVIARESWSSSKQDNVAMKLTDPDAVVEKKEEREYSLNRGDLMHMGGLDMGSIMGHRMHMGGSSGIADHIKNLVGEAVAASTTDTQKELLKLAQHIVDKEAKGEETSPGEHAPDAQNAQSPVN